jgi:hypothetical protein
MKATITTMAATLILLSHEAMACEPGKFCPPTEVSEPGLLGLAAVAGAVFVARKLIRK